MREKYKDIDTLYFIYKKGDSNIKSFQLNKKAIDFYLKFSNNLSVTVTHFNSSIENMNIETDHKSYQFQNSFLRKNKSNILCDKLVSKLNECQFAQGILYNKILFFLDLSEKFNGYYLMYEVTQPFLCSYDD